MSHDPLFRGNRSGGSHLSVGIVPSSSSTNHSHYNSHAANKSTSIYRLAAAVAVFFLGVYYFTSSDQTFGISSTANSAVGKSDTNKKAIDKLKPDGQLCEPDDAYRYFVSNTQTQARCIDGTRPAFYVRKGHGDGKNKWFVFFEGGGWCFDHKACAQRAQTHYGTSRLYPRCLAKQSMKDYLSAESHHNPLTYNWNVVHVKYCDGTSYSSSADVVYEGKKLFFRGKHNRDETIKSLLSLGMKDAQEVLIGGCSAGALAIYLGLDEMADIIHQRNPDISVRGIAFSGFFAEFSANEVIPPNGQTVRDDGIVSGKLDYANALRNVFLFSNMSAGANKQCVKFYTSHLNNEVDRSQQGYNIIDDPNVSFLDSNGTNMYPTPESRRAAHCAFAANLAQHIRTPLFNLQPQYDQWQIVHVLGRNYSTPSVNEFGKKVSSDLIKGFHYQKATTVNNGNELVTVDNPGHGSFIESCAHHCTSCSVEEDTWSGNKFLSASPDKVTPAIAIKTWYKASIPSYNFSHLMTHPIVNSTAGNSLLVAKNSMLFLQDFPFPCHSCCKCTVRAMPYLVSINAKGTLRK